MTTKREIFIMCEVKMYVNYSWKLGRGFMNFSGTFLERDFNAENFAIFCDTRALNFI
jgi:hypothetical protein